MAKIDVAAKTQKLYRLLKDASPEERQKIITAALTLFGEVIVAAVGAGGDSTAESGGGGAPGGARTIRAFFDAKQPKTRLEELAVAARYREQHQNATNHTRDDFKAAFAAAKRPFDGNNFLRDLGKARKAKFFNVGTDNLLSYFGEMYVDALPNREAAAAIKRPGKVNKKKRAAKKAK